MRLPMVYEKLHWRERREVREEYVKRQGGNCYHCKQPLKGLPLQEVLDMKITKGLFPENFFKYPVHLHHNHTTGMTIGAVHNYCNAVLWEYYGE